MPAPIRDRLSVVHTDITTLAVDAIVNAANETLLGGGGVDGAIHRAAGAELLAECRAIGGCPTGEARRTGGYHLRAGHVMHTVGPVWTDGAHGEPRLLARCYRESLRLALLHGARSVAFPAVSTGVYGYPPELAAEVAVRTIVEHLRDNDIPEQVLLCAFSAPAAAVLRGAVAAAT